jgi:peptidylprolyl isomerase
MNVHQPFATTRTTRRILTPGKGSAVEPGQSVTIDYVGVNGADGKEFDTSFGKADKATFTLDENQIIKGMVTGLTGVAVGSRVLVAIPPADGYGTSGAPSAGIGPTDTLVFVIDVKSAATVLARATGTTIKPKKGLPTVTLSKIGAPTIKIPSSKAPSSLVIQPLIQGKGDKVVKGQTITVKYTGVIWPGGKVFDNTTWQKNSPAALPIGVGKVITGWDQGLVGQRVGSQILLVVPPDKGYGVAGKAEAGIKGTDTLVFVVDILETAA